MSMTATLVASVDRAFRSLGDLIGKLTIRSHVETYVIATGAVSKVTTETEVEGIVAEYESEDIDGTVVQREDRRIFIKPVTGLVITVGDEIVDEDGITYTVQNPKQIRPRDTVLLWDIHARA